MIFIDANVPMYLAGAEHPNKRAAQTLLERFAEQNERLVTDAEVLQEILHRFSAIKRWDAIEITFARLFTIINDVFPVDRRDVERAKGVLLGEKRLSARDAIHVAVMERHGVSRIMSFDTSFDRLPGITRISS